MRVLAFTLALFRPTVGCGQGWQTIDVLSLIQESPEGSNLDVTGPQVVHLPGNQSLKITCLGNEYPASSPLFLTSDLSEHFEDFDASKFPFKVPVIAFPGACKTVKFDLLRPGHFGAFKLQALQLFTDGCLETPNFGLDLSADGETFRVPNNFAGGSSLFWAYPNNFYVTAAEKEKVYMSMTLDWKPFSTAVDPSVVVRLMTEFKICIPAGLA